jgi:hypothetical protein
MHSMNTTGRNRLLFRKYHRRGSARKAPRGDPKLTPHRNWIQAEMAPSWYRTMQRETTARMSMFRTPTAVPNARGFFHECPAQ